MKAATDWDRYYRQSSITTAYSRPITKRRLIHGFQRFVTPNPVTVELGGANSCVFDSVMKHIKPREYHLVDNNRFGLDLLRQRATDHNVRLHCADILSLELDVQADAAFSLGLIEHFDPAGTRNAILAHFRLLRPGGIAIITFPTPTLLYRATRSLAEILNMWAFPDERPLQPAEVIQAIQTEGQVLFEDLIWPIFLTQTLIVARKNGS